MESERRTEALRRLDDRHRARSLADREWLQSLVEVDRLGVWEGQEIRSMPQWVSARFGISNWQARKHIEAAYAIERLPLIGAALASGTLSLDKTVELTRFAAPETEKTLLRWALTVSPATIRRRADSEQKPKDEAREAEADRYLRYWVQDSGCLAIEGLLPPVEGAKVKSAIDRLASQLPKMPDGAVRGVHARAEAGGRLGRDGLCADRRRLGPRQSDRRHALELRRPHLGDLRLRARGRGAAPSRHRPPSPATAGPST